MDYSVVTGSGNRLPAETTGLDRSLSHSRAPVRNSPAFYFKPETRYRARLAHTMYVYDHLTLQQIGDHFGVSRQRAHQYVHSVEPRLNGRTVQRERSSR